jgi:hypothetical protein
MRSLDITRYRLEFSPDGHHEPLKCPKCGTEVEKPAEPPEYDVRNTLIEVLFSPELRLSAMDALERDSLARKIKDCPTNTLLLEEAEWQKIKQGLESLHGFGRNDIEFIRRVINAPEVAVKQAS